MNLFEHISQAYKAFSIFQEFQAILATVPDTIQYFEDERLMICVKAFKVSCPAIYDELHAAAHLPANDAIERLNALYPGVEMIRKLDNHERIVKAIQLVITANERRDAAWRESKNTSPLKVLSGKRVTKTRAKRIK
jgi:hypothetical protein